MHIAQSVVERESSPQGVYQENKQDFKGKEESSDHILGALTINTKLDNEANKQTSPSLFKQRLTNSIENRTENVSTSPLVPTTPSKAPDSVKKSTPAANKLGTVSFYSNVTNCRSPRMALISPSSKGRPLVQTNEGEHMPYDDWWKKMQRESKTPVKDKVNSWSSPQQHSSALNSVRTSSMFGSYGSSSSSESADGSNSAMQIAPKEESAADKFARERKQGMCKLLQIGLEGLTKERHCKLLAINVTVSVTTLRKVIANITGKEVEEWGNRGELIEQYVEEVHRQMDHEADDEEDDI